MKTTFQTPALTGTASPSIKRPTADGKQQNGFGAMLTDAVNEVERLQSEAERSVQAFASGEQRDIHNTMIALEKADVSFQLLSQVRNKVISAYETIMRMQV